MFVVWFVIKTTFDGVFMLVVCVILHRSQQCRGGRIYTPSPESAMPRWTDKQTYWLTA